MRPLALPPDGAARIRLVLYFTKGLGDVVTAEAAGIVPAAEIRQQQDRFLAGVAKGGLLTAALNEPGTALPDRPATADASERRSPRRGRPSRGPQRRSARLRLLAAGR